MCFLSGSRYQEANSSFPRGQFIGIEPPFLGASWERLAGGNKGLARRVLRGQEGSPDLYSSWAQTGSELAHTEHGPSMDRVYVFSAAVERERICNPVCNPTSDNWPTLDKRETRSRSPNMQVARTIGNGGIPLGTGGGELITRRSRVQIPPLQRGNRRPEG